MTTIVCSKCNRQVWPQGGSQGTATAIVMENNKFVCDACKELPSLGLNALRDEIKANNREKGWYDGEMPRPLEMHALMHSEIAEATEAVRMGVPPFFLDSKNNKPEGEATELMDCLIRILDQFGRMGWDADAVYRKKMSYNKTREYRHGGKVA